MASIISMSVLCDLGRNWCIWWEAARALFWRLYMSSRSQVLIAVDRSPLNLAGSVGCLFGSLIWQRVRDLIFFFPFSQLLCCQVSFAIPQAMLKTFRHQAQLNESELKAPCLAWRFRGAGFSRDWTQFQEAMWNVASTRLTAQPHPCYFAWEPLSFVPSLEEKWVHL